MFSRKISFVLLTLMLFVVPVFAETVTNSVPGIFQHAQSFTRSGEPYVALQTEIFTTPEVPAYEDKTAGLFQFRQSLSVQKGLLVAVAAQNSSSTRTLASAPVAPAAPKSSFFSKVNLLSPTLFLGLAILFVLGVVFLVHRFLRAEQKLIQDFKNNF